MGVCDSGHPCWSLPLWPQPPHPSTASNQSRQVPGIFGHLYLIGNVWNSTAEDNSSEGFGGGNKSLFHPSPLYI